MTLKITIPDVELFDDKTQEFITVYGQQLELEHSLISLSKWESKFCKPFLTDDKKTAFESAYYVKCMTMTQNVKNDEMYYYISEKVMKEIQDYIALPMTAVKFGKQGNKTFNKETTTNEIIYYWMITLQIPVEFQKWHLNRLLTLINVCNIKNQPVKKRSANDILTEQARQNEIRKAQLHTEG